MSPPPSKPQRILVTGGRGRLASLIADRFRGPGYETALFSRRATTGFRPLAELTHPAVLENAEVLLHLAWSSLPATSEQNPGCEEKEDLPLLANMLQALGQLPAARRPLLVFFSSGGAVYGNAPGRPSREEDPCHPIGCYGRAKLAAEKLLQTAATRHGLPSTILRISNPYGYPVPSGRAQGVIPRAIRCALEGEPLTLWGDGHAQKDFLHHTDFLAALAGVVARRLTGLYNLGFGESHSVQEIVALVEKHTGRKICTQQTTAPAWDVQDSRLDHRRLSAAIGWQPRVSLDEGIRRAIAEHGVPN